MLGIIFQPVENGTHKGKTVSSSGTGLALHHFPATYPVCSIEMLSNKGILNTLISNLI